MKYITTKKQFLYIFGVDRDKYLEGLTIKKEYAMKRCFLREEEIATEIEDRSYAIELKKIMNWNGQESADLQYNGHELVSFKHLLQGNETKA